MSIKSKTKSRLMIDGELFGEPIKIRLMTAFEKVAFQTSVGQTEDSEEIGRIMGEVACSIILEPDGTQAVDFDYLNGEMSDGDAAEFIRLAFTENGMNLNGNDASEELEKN